MTNNYIMTEVLYFAILRQWFNSVFDGSFASK